MWEKLRHPGHDGSASHSPQGADLYEVLGVDRSASADDLRAAYRQRARETHPDAGGAPGEFQAVQAAWEVLGDEERRRRYDRSARPIGREPSHEACLTFLMSPSLLLCDASSQQVSPAADARTSSTRPATGIVVGQALHRVANMSLGRWSML